MVPSKSVDVYSILLTLGVLFLLSSTVIFLYNTEVAKNTAVKAHIDARDPILSRTIIDYYPDEEGTGIIVYGYLGEKLPEKIVEDEVVQMRNEVSYTRKIGVVDEGTKNERPVLEFIGSNVQQFVMQGGEWHYRKEATTTAETFSRAMEDDPIMALFVRTAHAASFVKAAGSGRIQSSSPWPGGFATACASPTGGVSLASISALTYSEIGGTETIRRAFIPFDTSGIPNGAVITTATLTFTGVTISDNSGSDFVRLIETNQATHTTLVNTDFNNVNTVAGSPDQTLTSLLFTSVVSFPLNATGLTWIKTNGEASLCSATAGISCFGLRLGGDIGCIPPCDTCFDSITIGGSGTLSAAYIGEPSFAFWQFQDF